MRPALQKEVEAGAWRDVHEYTSWDEADARRKATMDDNPSLDVRLDPRHGQYVLQVKGPAKK